MWWSDVYHSVIQPPFNTFTDYCKLFSTGDLVHKMLNTFDMQELSGTLTRTQPGKFQETL